MILLSIHPEYVEKIVSKMKTFEFRKLTPKDFNLDPRIAIYSTRPMCRIVAYVEVSRILSGKPSGLWHRTSKWAGIDRTAFETYFEGYAKGFAFEISKVHKLVRPITLNEAGYYSDAPQSFCYLTSSQVAKIVAAGKRTKTTSKRGVQ